jgi:predicted GIY-YIG superfamily endonuclease
VSRKKVNNEMNEKFKNIIDKMPLLLQSLLRQPPIIIDEIGITPVPQMGVYVLFEGDNPIYVGRSNRMKQRLKEHSQRSSDHWSATLAMRIAKQEYFSAQKEGRRRTNEQLMRNSVFREKFEAAKSRIAKTRIRFIEIEDQVEQTIFEIYAALVLDTELKDFSTH